MENKLSAGSQIPDIDISLINGDSARLSKKTSNWTLLIVYRGLHCPICKDYATKFENKLSKLQDINTQLILISADPKGKIHIIEISNAPFVRPDIDLIFRGINHIQKNNYPIRGTH